MNKDVIYIEPEDDITNILTGVRNSKAKVVALVPPKKTSVLRSAVNFKLLARTAKEASKAIVLVTSDSALLKLAATVGIPVAKNLQSKPSIPTDTTPDSKSKSSDDDTIDGKETDNAKAEKKSPKTDEDPDTESIELEEDEEKSKSGDKKNSKKKSLVPNLDKYRKFIIMGVVGLVLLIGFVVWALVLAPSAKIMVSVRTTTRPFSETISFTTDENKQDPSEGFFLLETHKITKQTSVDFEATGEVDKGDRATGTLTFKRTSPVSSANATPITIPSGTKFSSVGKTFITTEDATLAAVDASNCSPILFSQNCNLTKDVVATAKVIAEAPGTDYNLNAASSGWTPSGGAYTISSSAMAGGTTRVVKIVSASDVARAKEKLTSLSTSEGKTELLDEFPVGLIAITASFKTESNDPVSTPAVGEEVADDIIPKLVAKTTFSMFGVDRVRIDEYIRDKITQAIVSEEGQTIYSTGVSDNPDENKAFIESFREADGAYTAKLKSNAKVGPEVTDQMVIDKSLGRKTGEVQSLLKSINGISKVEIKTSFFWVTSVPKDINKVSVEITVE